MICDRQSSVSLMFPFFRSCLARFGTLRTWPGCLLAVVIVVVTLAAACPTPAAAQTSAPGPSLRVLTSFLPVHSLALAVAGDRAQVENWLPQGVDPHEFQFSPRDLRRLRASQILVVGGLKLEGWAEAQLRKASGSSNLVLVEAATGLPPTALVYDEESGGDHHDHSDHAGHDHAGGPNPHFWLDPLLGAHAVTNLVHAFSRSDPPNAQSYAANGARCVARLHALDAEYRQSLASVRSNAFITFHNAFPYLARRYQLKLVGVVETNAAEDPSARELASLGHLVRREGVRVLFVDGPPSRLARRLASDLKLRLATLETLETGTLGPNAYEEGLRRNLSTLRQSLGSPSPR